MESSESSKEDDVGIMSPVMSPLPDKVITFTT